ncbi:MAG TPA: phosphatidylserine decarboxylase family protein [Deltaproteobacteria bacterium]|nr:phosphatidylserine decarboxylase family protein [Deltaproteobacteria bacterium]HQB38506.1 phosphatidylserine decarboxylase family protein [Deltaproteobacteria bacterium]
MMNSTTPIAREGFPFIALSTGLTLLLAISAWQFCSTVLWLMVAFTLSLSLFITFFFRDPERVAPEDVRAVLSPADGKVVVSECVPTSPLGSAALKISIFMSVFDVHVNRTPLSGRVTGIAYDQGRFFDVRDGRASCENERSCILLDAECGVRIAFVQIAGLIARRIVSNVKLGDHMRRGERYGMICFGSRLDVYLPTDVQPLVKIGDRTVAGETVLGRIA